MKLIYAIVRYDNEDEVVTALTKEHFSVTRLATNRRILKEREYDADDRYGSGPRP